MKRQCFHIHFCVCVFQRLQFYSLLPGQCLGAYARSNPLRPQYERPIQESIPSMHRRESTLQLHGLKSGGCCSSTTKQVHCLTRRNLTRCRLVSRIGCLWRGLFRGKYHLTGSSEPESQPLVLAPSPNPYTSRHSRIFLAFETILVASVVQL